MDTYDFVNSFITAFFNNQGIRQITIFCLGAFGFLCLYHIVMGLMVRRK